MYLYSIVSLDTDHLEEICQDIKEQYEQGVANFALFNMTLVPEGDPPIPKAEQMCEKFDLFRDRLKEMGISCGVLVQATIGHGYPLNRMFPFTRVKDATDGTVRNVVCPYDEGFREYLKHIMQVIASHKPDCIMVDDDFRLIIRPGKGCLCEHHVAAICKKLGVEMTREELSPLVLSEEPENKKFRDAFIETQLESLVGGAKSMREGIDSVDPTLPGLFCCVGDACEAATEIATILAGKGNPVIVRINNGNYTPAGARNLSSSFMRAATQRVVLRAQGHVDSILAETDTCPQNRYSTGARSLHSHFTGTILEGASGAKHWITRLTTFEPKSGLAYRKMLSEHRGFYDELSKLVPTLKWRGNRMPLSTLPDYTLERISVNAWTTHLFERFGLPVYFSEENSKVTFLEGRGDVRFTDDEITEMLKNTLVLDGGAALRLCNRGFKELLGVDVKPWTGKNITGELFLTEGGTCKGQVEARELIPLNDKVIADSLCYHVADGITKEPLFPGCTIYKNELGGTAIVFCGNVRTMFNFVQAFAFLNETRKRQLIRLLGEHGDLPVYYPDDAEVYLKTADCPDGSTFVAFFNVSLDMIEEITLCADFEPKSIECLNPDGKRVPCEFKIENGVITVSRAADTLDPQILFLK